MKKQPWEPVPGFMRVSSGGYRAVVKATSVKKAFALFLKAAQPKQLGFIAEFYGLSIDDPEHLAYASCQRLLEGMGRWEP